MHYPPMPPPQNMPPKPRNLTARTLWSVPDFVDADLGCQFGWFSVS
jgi:hypothetical protein